MIDSKSLIHESASIADNVKIGAYSIIDKNVSIGEGSDKTCLEREWIILVVQ